jgi:hypothetical protein
MIVLGYEHKCFVFVFVHLTVHGKSYSGRPGVGHKRGKTQGEPLQCWEMLFSKIWGWAVAHPTHPVAPPMSPLPEFILVVLCFLNQDILLFLKEYMIVLGYEHKCFMFVFVHHTCSFYEIRYIKWWICKTAPQSIGRSVKQTQYLMSL